MSVWENELRCPHCRKAQTVSMSAAAKADQSSEYGSWSCDRCHREFRWTAYVVPAFKAITPEKYDTNAARLRDAQEGMEE